MTVWLAVLAPFAAAQAPVAASARGTPREAFAGFLAAGYEGQFATAASYLDLSGVPAEARERDGQRLARRLYLVLLHRAWTDPEEVSNDPAGRRQADLPENTERIATLEIRGKEVEIVLERRVAGGLGEIWLVSRQSVASIDALYRAHGYGGIGDRLPSFFFSLSFAGLQLWQWAAIALAILLGFGAGRLLASLLVAVLGRLASRTTVGWDDAMVRAIDGPLGIVLWGLSFALAAPWAGLSPGALHLTQVGWKMLTLVAVGWLLFRLLDELTRQMLKSAGGLNHVALGYLPVLSRAGKFVVAAFLFLGALDIVGVNVLGLLAGLGLGGLALAFAAQKTLENVFGALAIAADQPFKAGDFVTVGGVTGTVEDIGLRSLRIRTLERTLVTIPNGVAVADKIVNLSERDRFFFNPTLSLLQATPPAKLREILDAIRALLAGHPQVFSDDQRVTFLRFGASSLDLEVQCWILAAPYNDAAAVMEDLNFAIAAIVEGAGSAFAFPSQTVYLVGQSCHHE
ncbi:MAG: mechanosensitive ion channel domain-containing protein [Acidobacteriota bacterium]